MKIIDADGHITESEKDIKKYLPEPYCRRSGTLVPSIGADARMAGRFSSDGHPVAGNNHHSACGVE
jgi:hypothetical protein